jgi:hypothetical protein
MSVPVKKLVPGRGKAKIKVKILDYQLTRGGITEYTLEDGTIVRLEPRLQNVLQEIDEQETPVLNRQGIPVYHFNFGVQTQVIPKNRTIYLTKPPRPSKTPPSGMTV